MTIATVVCLVGSFFTVSAAAAPMWQHSSNLVSGVTSAVGRAISHANVQAEKHAQRHYEAREEYLSRRRLSVHKTPHAGQGHAQSSHELELESHVSEALAITKPKSALLLRMAALRKADAPGAGIDDGAVEQFFPGWIIHRNQKQWDEDAVLKDVVLAVSQLAHAVSVDTAPGSNGVPEDNTPSVPAQYAPPT